MFALAPCARQTSYTKSFLSHTTSSTPRVSGSTLRHIRERDATTPNLCCFVRVAPVGKTVHVAISFGTTVVQRWVPAQLCQKKNSKRNVFVYSHSSSANPWQGNYVAAFIDQHGLLAYEAALALLSSAKAALPDTQHTTESWNCHVGRCGIFHTTLLAVELSAHSKKIQGRLRWTQQVHVILPDCWKANACNETNLNILQANSMAKRTMTCTAHLRWTTAFEPHPPCETYTMSSARSVSDQQRAEHCFINLPYSPILNPHFVCQTLASNEMKGYSVWFLSVHEENAPDLVTSLLEKRRAFTCVNPVAPRTRGMQGDYGKYCCRAEERQHVALPLLGRRVVRHVQQPELPPDVRTAHPLRGGARRLRRYVRGRSIFPSTQTTTG